MHLRHELTRQRSAHFGSIELRKLADEPNIDDEELLTDSLCFRSNRGYKQSFCT